MCYKARSGIASPLKGTSMTVVVRISEEAHESARRIAALQGRSLTDLLDDAWNDYLEKHREDFAAKFEEAAKLLRQGDTEGLAALASESVEARAAAAVSARNKQ
jgi:hypothetical protein